MSAFIVEDKTINRIIYTLNSVLREGEYVVRPLVMLGYEKFDAKLGKDMFALNIRSIEERYGEGEAKTFRPLNYKFKEQMTSNMQGLKSLHCFQYQSCEGECDSDPLYLALEQVALLLASYIIHRLPEYDKLEWG